MQEWIKFHQRNTPEENIHVGEEDLNHKDDNKTTAVDLESFLNENERLFLYSFKNFDSCISDVDQQWHISDDELQKDTTQSSIPKTEIVRTTEGEFASKDTSLETKAAVESTDMPPTGKENVDNVSNELEDTKEICVPKEEIDKLQNPSGTVKEETANKKNRYPWTRKKIINCSRKFNLDLIPRLLYSLSIIQILRCRRRIMCRSRW